MIRQNSLFQRIEKIAFRNINSFKFGIYHIYHIFKNLIMNLKKFFSALLVALLMSAVIPVFAAETPVTRIEVPKEVRAQQIETRLIEIRDLAKTNLTAAEKKELRKEVKSLKKEERRNGVYLSVGAIIIIVLLLILLL